MPLIQNKKSGVEDYVTTDAWIEFQKKGFDSRFKILDDSDLQETVIRKPEIFELEKKDYDNITASELREELEKMGIEPGSANKKELYQLYIDG